MTHTPVQTPSEIGRRKVQLPEPRVLLTGIKATGEVHLGNYVGAIRPALKLVAEYESYIFIANYHALTSERDPESVYKSTRQVAAAWLACGLDPSRTTLYKQSDLPEVFELAWVLSCVTGKGLMNRAHSYKAVRDRNKERGVADLDAGVNMGLYNYPVLMAADILIMASEVVPVGRDQMQHLEYTADIAGSYNHAFSFRGFEFPIPEGLVARDESALLPGLDGRKMSKSYDNTIPLFCTESELKKLIRRIKTDSTPVDAPKDPDSSHVFVLFSHFAEPGDVAEIRRRLKEGRIGWGELKDLLFEAINTHVSPLRDRYLALIEPGSELDGILADGAVRARRRAREVLAGVRHGVGVEA